MIKSNKMKFIKWIFVAASLFVLSSCSGTKKSKEVKKITKVEQVRTTILKKQNITRTINLSTILEGYTTLNVFPSIQGHIEKIFVEVGDHVKKGDDLVRMDQTQYKNALITYNNLVTEMKRMEGLKEGNAVSQQNYDNTKMSLDQAKAQLDFLKQNTYFEAPFSGVISAKNYENGELLSGSPVVVLTKISELKALVNVSEIYYTGVKKGTKVNIISELYPDKVFNAEVEIVYPTIDPTSHTFTVKLRIPNQNMKLRPGMYVRTKLLIGKDNVLLVPYLSVLKLTGSNNRYIYINEGGKAKRIFVNLGQRFDDNIEIISPELKEGMEVVTTGQSKLVEGVKLNIVK